MSVQTRGAVVLAALCGGCFAHGGRYGGGLEGVTIVRQQATGPAEVVIVDGERLRMETGGEGHRSITIVDAHAPRIIEIDEADRTYVELGKKELEGVRGANDGTSELSELQFDRRGEHRTINGITCEMVEGARSGRLWEEDCIVPWETGLFHKEDFAASSKFLRERMRVPETIANDLFRLLDFFPGFPIERRALMGSADLLGDNPPPEQVKSVTRGPIPATTFSAPAGYTKREPAVSR